MSKLIKIRYLTIIVLRIMKRCKTIIVTNIYCLQKVYSHPHWRKISTEEQVNSLDNDHQLIPETLPKIIDKTTYINNFNKQVEGNNNNTKQTVCEICTHVFASEKNQY